MPAATRQVLYRVLADALQTLSHARIPYVLGGGLAAEAYGLRETLNDIDAFVRPVDAPAALRALDAAGYYGWIEDPRWLYKAIKDTVTVDIIYQSAGLVKVSDETFQRARRVDIGGIIAPVMPPEDFFVMKAVAATPGAPKHWLDAISLLVTQPIDWEYLSHLSTGHAGKILPAVIQAHDEGVQVPSRFLIQVTRDLIARRR